MAESEEAALLARCRRGDREAQEALVRRYQQKVYRLACGLLGNPEEALDASQESLVAMLRSLRSYRGEARFQTWLYQLTTNVCLMQRRRTQARTRILTEFPTDHQQNAGEGNEPERRALNREMQGAIREHLRKLPAEFRAVVVLRELEEMSYDEIAEILRVPMGTVQSRLNRGRRLLRLAMLADERIPTPRKGGEQP
jgi:RNA polymerase sigma-70 factor (ECF subfamily)